MEENRFQREVLDRLIILETLIKQQDYKEVIQKQELINREIIKESQKIKDNTSRISKLEDINKWLWRTVIGAMMLGAMAIVFGI